MNVHRPSRPIDIAAPLPAHIETSRLSLRRLVPDDLEELVAVCAERDVWEYPYGRGMTRAEAEAFLGIQLDLWMQHGFGGCAARSHTDGRLLGVVGLSTPSFPSELVANVTVGWRFAPGAWGNGYATEGAAALLTEAFTTMGVARVGCVTQPENVRSVRVAERLGMRMVGEVGVPPDDRASGVTAVVYEMDARDWSTTAV